MSTATSVGLLYDGYGNPAGTDPLPPFDGPQGAIHTRPVCDIVFNIDHPGALGRTDVDLALCLPVGIGPHPISPDDLAKMAACLDDGGRVAIHGTHDVAITAAADTIRALLAGDRA